MKPVLARARWLLVRTTEYVQLTHLSTFREESRMPTYYEVDAAAGRVPSQPFPWYWKDNERIEVPPEKHAKAVAKWEREKKRIERARAAYVKQAKKDAALTPAAERKFSVTIGNAVLGRNYWRRVRVMRTPDARRLASLDATITRLQQQRRQHLIRAWDRAITVDADDLVTLAQRARLPSIRDSRPDRNLNSTDTVWPPSLRPKKTVPAPAQEQEAA